MGIDLGEVELSGDEEKNGSHGLEASVSAGFSLCGLKQFVDGFDQPLRSGHSTVPGPPRQPPTATIISLWI